MKKLPSDKTIVLGVFDGIFVVDTQVKTNERSLTLKIPDLYVCETLA